MTLQLTADDIASITTTPLSADGVADIRFAISPLQHLITGILMRDRSREANRWWRLTRSNMPNAAAPLLDLVSISDCYAPDFLTPPIAASDTTDRTRLRDELDAIAATSPARIRGQTWHLQDKRDLPRRVQALRDGDTREMTRLVDAVRALFQAGLAEDWPRLRGRLGADIAHRGARMAAVGVGAALSELAPRWRADAESALGFLRAVAPSELPDVEGGGFLLMPNLFALGQPTPVITYPHPPAFVYPAHRGAAAPAADGRDGLGALIGRGKAAALRAIGTGVTTTELAERLKVSRPAASVHASSLRAAGLVGTVRDGRQVVHSLTGLGAALLDAHSPW